MWPEKRTLRSFDTPDKRAIDYTWNEALSLCTAEIKLRASVEELSIVIYDNIYQDKPPKNEMSARIECKLLAEAISKHILEDLK